jgi:hypothetical protein
VLIRQESESGHFYAKDGSTAYRIIGANGKERNTTLRDAKKHGLVPSVTTILSQIAKPGLDTWKQTQVLLAALTLPRGDNETEQDWLQRVMADSKATGRDAANRGTQIHGVLESYFEGTYIPEWPLYVHNVHDVLVDTFGTCAWDSEKSFAHDLGYGGKLDLSADNVVVDFKTKETPLESVVPYHEHILQLSAYRMGLNMPQARCAIAFVNGITNEVKLCEISEEELQKGWECFKHLLSYYQLKNNL